MPESRNAAAGPSHSPRARRQVFNSLSTRIIFFVFLSTFLTALVVSWISIHAIQGQLQAELDRRFPSILDDHVDAVESLIVDLESTAAFVAADPMLRQALAHEATTRAAFSAILEERLAGRTHFDGLLLLSAKGVPLATAGEIDDQTRQASVLSVTRDANDTGHRTVTLEARAETPASAVILVPVGSRSDPRAWLAAHHGFDRFKTALSAGSDAGSAHLTLVGDDGRILASGSEPASERVIVPALARISDNRVHEYTTAEHGHVLGAARPLPHGHWTVLVEAPFDEAFAPVLSVVSRIFISDLVIILVFSFLAYKITATIMRPIRALSDGARRISRGDYDHAIPDSRASDEIGLLIRTFNDMVAQLRRNSTEIEDDQRRLTEQNEELQRANEVLAQLSITDGLTKLHNHRYFQDHLTREIKRIGRTGEALSMILMDLDDFKKLNDLYGHSAGDELLVGVANILVESVRESDLLARYGGEEFVILATGTSFEGAISMAEKIRMSVEGSSHIADDSMRPIRVTISIGVATYEGDRRAFFQAADRALYDAKAQGKNCVIAAEPTAPVDDA